MGRKKSYPKVGFTLPDQVGAIGCMEVRLKVPTGDPIIDRVLFFILAGHYLASHEILIFEFNCNT